MQNDALLDRRVRLLGAASPLFYRRPLQLVRGEGVWLFDAEGRRYLDAYNNVAHVGHCHPHVVEALTRQAKTLNTHTRYLHAAILDYGEALTATFDGELSMLHLCCSGTEANELALRIAKASSGATGIIVTDFCYHGNSAAIAALSTAFPGPEGIGANVRSITAPDPYRQPDGAEQFGAQVRDAIDSLAASGLKPAALLIDTIFATEGMPSVPAGYIQDAVARIRAAGGLYIADEVQPGFGRTGAHNVGLSALRYRPRPGDPGQADGQRPSPGRGGEQSGAKRRIRRKDNVFQYLRRQSGVLRGGIGGLAGDCPGRPDGERPQGRRVFAGRATQTRG
jgi:4-aminobutyrate aminotransferase-like enzyme